MGPPWAPLNILIICYNPSCNFSTFLWHWFSALLYKSKGQKDHITISQNMSQFCAIYHLLEWLTSHLWLSCVTLDENLTSMVCLFIPFHSCIFSGFNIHSNYGQSHTNARSCLVSWVEPTVPKLNVQCSASRVIYCHWNTPLASQIINKTWIFKPILVIGWNKKLLEKINL